MYIRKISRFFLVLLTFQEGVLLATAFAQPQLKKFERKDCNYSFEYPASWQIFPYEWSSRRDGITEHSGNCDFKLKPTNEDALRKTGKVDEASLSIVVSASSKPVELAAKEAGLIKKKR